MINRTIPISAINREISQIAKNDEAVAVTLRGDPVLVIVPMHEYADMQAAWKYCNGEPPSEPKGLLAFLRRLFA